MALDLSVSYRAPVTARQMAEAASRFLAALDDPRRKAAQFAFDDHERYRWNYRPDGFDWEGRTFWHEGLRLINMTTVMQRAALALLETGLSEYGAGRARAIVELEHDLRETERHTANFVRHVVRDPELYAFAVFGQPGGAAPWAWRAGGHHLGLHFTVVDGESIAPTPLFFGCNPAEVRHGSNLGKRTLPEEEDRARDLLLSLAPERKRLALVSETAPPDILTDAHRSANPGTTPAGLRAAAMSGQERQKLVDLVKVYVNRTAEEIASAQWRKIEQAGLDSLTFAWLGGAEPGQGHYYAIKGPTFAIEYDCTQDGANHIHSVWRDYSGDWGEDLLAQHYAEAHRAGADRR
jgi:hypothetical protein